MAFYVSHSAAEWLTVRKSIYYLIYYSKNCFFVSLFIPLFMLVEIG